MISAVYSLLQVRGAELWLLFWLICVMVYLGVCFLIRYNRTKKGAKNVLIGLLIAEVIIDLVLAFVYYDNGIYLNYGIGAVYGLLLWVPILAATSVIITGKNKRANR